jgi:hypothetical protein
MANSKPVLIPQQIKFKKDLQANTISNFTKKATRI